MYNTLYHTTAVCTTRYTIPQLYVQPSSEVSKHVDDSKKLKYLENVHFDL